MKRGQPRAPARRVVVMRLMRADGAVLLGARGAMLGAVLTAHDTPGGTVRVYGSVDGQPFSGDTTVVLAPGETLRLEITHEEG